MRNVQQQHQVKHPHSVWSSSLPQPWSHPAPSIIHHQHHHPVTININLMMLHTHHTAHHSTPQHQHTVHHPQQQQPPTIAQQYCSSKNLQLQHTRYPSTSIMFHLSLSASTYGKQVVPVFQNCLWQRWLGSEDDNDDDDDDDDDDDEDARSWDWELTDHRQRLVEKVVVMINNSYDLLVVVW